MPRSSPESPDSHDVHSLGPETTYQVVQGDHNDTRDWLAGHPHCPLFEAHHIAHAGIMRVVHPFEITRHDQSGTFMLSCFGGTGRILVDGSWLQVNPGDACLLPPFVKNSLRSLPGKHWHFSWVRYLESRENAPILAAHSPVKGRYPPLPLRHAIEGLHAEAESTQAPSTMQLWTDLIQNYVTRFALPHRGDNRLWKIWREVELNPAQPWTLAQLAAKACVSEEHLRRICKKDVGRSPMQHVTFIRMQCASRLLATTDDKIETICRAVGYQNPYTFSTTFKKWVGWRPSQHRQRSQLRPE